MAKTEVLRPEFVSEMLSLFRREELTLWEQGDKLATEGLSALAMEKAADVFKRDLKTLQDREKVSRMFLEGATEDVPRNVELPWSVYKHLARLSSAAKRLKVWGTRPPEEWTVTAMKDAVNQASKAADDGTHSVQRHVRRFHFQGYTLILEDPAGDLSITVESPLPLKDADEPKRLDARKFFVRFIRDI